MYGFVNYALEQLVLRNFGEDVWNQIKEKADLQLNGKFIQRIIYEDVCTFDLVTAATEVLGLDASKILQTYGKFFFQFCQESGYDVILSTLGSNVREFLQNLDALHDHLSSIYPGMRAPSFRCSDGKDNSLILHYYSERDGLEDIVIGIVQSVTKEIHNCETEVTVIQPKNEHCDHVQLKIVAKEGSSLLGNRQNELAAFGACDNSKSVVDTQTFAKALPFHIIFDQNMQVRQAGVAIARVIPQLRPLLPMHCDFGDSCERNKGKTEVENDVNHSNSCKSDDGTKITELFDLVRPPMPLLFHQIQSQINQVFVLRAKTGVLKTSQCDNTKAVNCDFATEQKSLRLKGQMIDLPDEKCILFLCSPSVMNLDDLTRRGLYLSDIPLHDATRDLVLLGEQFEEEYKLAQDLEILTDILQHTLRAREKEKRMTEKLLYAVLPPSVANSLRHKRQVEPMRYENVTVLFSGISGFNKFCSKQSHAEGAHAIVSLLNSVYTTLDQLIDPKNSKLYKVLGRKQVAYRGFKSMPTFWKISALKETSTEK